MEMLSVDFTMQMPNWNSPITFDNYINGIKNSTEYSDEYKLVLIDVANNAFPQFSNSVKDAGENANKMTVLLSELKTASDNISVLSSAFKEISDDGYLSVQTISKIQEATKLSGEEWESYKTKLLKRKDFFNTIIKGKKTLEGDGADINGQ